jgi:hypothetical protein
MKVEQAQKQQKETPAATTNRNAPTGLQKQVMREVRFGPCDTQFEAILDAYARDPERWDGLE